MTTFLRKMMENQGKLRRGHFSQKSRNVLILQGLQGKKQIPLAGLEPATHGLGIRGPDQSSD